eukprot:4688520-Pleurochrysis_carterae.AAC.2
MVFARETEGMRNRNSGSPPGASSVAMGSAPAVRQLQRQLEEERAQRGAAAAAIAKMQEDMRQLEADAASASTRACASRAAANRGKSVTFFPLRTGEGATCAHDVHTHEMVR